MFVLTLLNTIFHFMTAFFYGFPVLSILFINTSNSICEFFRLSAVDVFAPLGCVLSNIMKFKQ